MSTNADEIISTLLLSLYETPANPTHWGTFLSTLQSATGSQSAGVLIHDLATRATMGVTNGVEAAEERKFYEHYAAVNPWMPSNGIEIAQGEEILRTDSYQPLSEYRKTEFYNDWGKRNDVVFSIAINLRISTEKFYYVCLNRGERAGTFPASTDRLLSLLTPHIRQALRVVALDTAPAASSAATFLLGPQSVILSMSARARQLVDNRDGLKLVRVKHLAATADENAIAMMLDSIASDRFGQPRFVRIPRADAKPDLVLLIRPHKRRGQFMATVVDPHSAPTATIEAAAKAFGLTPAECRLVVALLKSGGLDRAVESLQISRNTAKKQMDSIFRKTNATRQAEVIRLFAALGGMAHMGVEV